MSRLVAGILPAALLATTAHAVRPSKELPERTVELASTKPARVAPRAATAAPAATSQAWSDFRTRRGAWQAIWDTDRGVPTSVWGQGIHVPGSTADAATAEDAARRVLADELALLAPGAAASDFVVERNHLRAGIRTVWLRQHHRGLPVVGAQVGFSFKDDTLLVMRSSAAPHLGVAPPAVPVARDLAEKNAAAWVEAAYRAAPAVLGSGDAQVLPVVLDDGTLTAHVVIPVTVDLAKPRGQWTVWVDAKSGEPVARRQQLLFGQGTLRYRVPVRYPAGGYENHAAAFAAHLADGIAASSDGGGLFTWAGAAASTVTPGLAGTYATITNAEGALATDALSVPDAGEAVWDRSSEEKADAQLTAFVHATIAKRYAIDTLDPDLPWLHQSMPVIVNEPDICNAYSMLDDIHFFVQGTFEGFGTCDNTARLPDVVYHEFGHSLHGQGSGQTDFTIWSDGMFALSEGTSDYYAATITGDPAMGRGFLLDDPNPLRHIDPVGVEKVYPDDLVGQSHADGEIISGALWDLRKALIAELGEGPGVTLADDIYYGVIVNAQDMTGAYAEALLVDDDDGDLSNGTPHRCLIQTAFDLHGLGEGASVLTALEPPRADGLTLTFDKPEIAGGGGECPAAGITAVNALWRLRGETDFQTLPFTEGADAFTVTLPDDAWGQVLEYQVQVLIDGGGGRTFPTNFAEPWYEAFVGEVTVLHCADFETDPGWTLGTAWQIGAPGGAPDPEAAHSGAAVLGTVLGGVYPPDAAMMARTPEIDVSGYDTIRLQYRRWLGVETSIFDIAQIQVDGAQLWVNTENGAHLDNEWMFRDLDITPLAGDGAVQVEFSLTTDPSVEFGGWNLDDVCVVGVSATAPVCGDAVVNGADECDDGNSEDGDGCSATCEIEEEPPPTEDGGCCSTGGGGATGSALLALATLGLVIPRGRRRWSRRRAR